MGGTGIRRVGSLVVCGALALVVAAPASAHEVSSSRDTFVIAEAAYGTLDPETMVGDQTLVSLQQMGPGEWFLGYERIRTREVTCTMGTRATTDDEPGLVGTLAIGEGVADATRVDGRKLRWAKASGEVEVMVFEIDTCEGAFDPVSEDTLTVAIDLTAAGRIRRTHERMRWVDPGVELDMQMLHLALRPGAGSLTIDGTSHAINADQGIIGRVRARDHYVIH